MYDKGSFGSRLIEYTWDRHIRDFSESEGTIGDVLRVLFLEEWTFGGGADDGVDVVVGCEEEFEDGGTETACCAGEEDGGLRHGGFDFLGWWFDVLMVDR